MSNAIDASAYHFDPTYAYSLEQLLAVPTPKAPADFTQFWEACYKQALMLNPQPSIKLLDDTAVDWHVYEITYTSTNQMLIQGWLLLPASGVIKRGFIVGHGYGGRDAPDFHLPFKDAALLFPCFRGLGKSSYPSIPSDAYQHVLHHIEQKESYILRGCVEDLWLAVSALLMLFPHLKGHLGYLGISFGGGIGALGLAFEQRIARGHLNIPSFGQQALRIRLKTLGSASSIQQYYCKHKKSTLKVLRYYDAAIAAQSIKIPMHCACALFDPAVAPPTQFAIYNAIPALKQLYLLDAGHHSYQHQAQQEAELLHELKIFFESLK